VQYFHVRICCACRSGGLIALMVVGHTSSHSLRELKDTSGGHDCWERRLLIRHEQMKAGSATELSQPLLFAAGHHRHHRGVCAFSEARCRLQIVLSGLMLVSFITLMNVSCSARPEIKHQKGKNYVFTHCNTHCNTKQYIYLEIPEYCPQILSRSWLLTSRTATHIKIPKP